MTHVIHTPNRILGSVINLCLTLPLIFWHRAAIEWMDVCVRASVFFRRRWKARSMESASSSYEASRLRSIRVPYCTDDRLVKYEPSAGLAHFWLYLTKTSPHSCWKTWRTGRREVTFSDLHIAQCRTTNGRKVGWSYKVDQCWSMAISY